MTLYSFIYKTENSCAQNSIFSYPSYFCSDVYLKCLLWNNAYCLFYSTLVFSIYVCCRCRPDLCSITLRSELHQSLSGDPLQISHRELGYLQIQTAILALRPAAAVSDFICLIFYAFTITLHYLFYRIVPMQIALFSCFYT